MADKKFGQKRVCPQCEKKFYDFNKKSPFKCPCCEYEITVENEDIFLPQNNPVVQQPQKSEAKDEFADIDNADDAADDDDGVISLDDAASEEEQNSKN